MKPSLPQGTRDFAPAILRKRQYILNTIKSIFELYGYAPLETPAMENVSTLTGKYGDEGDKLIFKILNNGLHLPEKREESKLNFDKVLQGATVEKITERALRYDLTIPFARFVAMNRNELALPFKRYQMQPVWRADRPQKGRYREFWQCDADVVGSDSLYLDAELLNMYYTAFNQLKIPVAILINNRKILAALAEKIQLSHQLTTITIAIDKLDKIGIDGVLKELATANIQPDAIEQINAYLQIKGDNESQLIAIEKLLGDTEQGKKGIEELKETLSTAQMINSAIEVQLDFTLARGLDYYTGMIVEVKPTAFAIGSIGGGGRYDNLTGVFDYPGVSGVGISFGIDRIFDVCEGMQLFPEDLDTNQNILFINFGGEAFVQTLQYTQALRAQGIACTLYPESVKMDKQMKYANKCNFKYVALVGENELKNKTIVLKNFKTGEQQVLTIEQLIQTLNN